MTTTIMIIGAVIAFVAVLASARSGPRITEITRTRRKEKDGDDA